MQFYYSKVQMLPRRTRKEKEEKDSNWETGGCDLNYAAAVEAWHEGLTVREICHSMSTCEWLSHGERLGIGILEVEILQSLTWLCLPDIQQKARQGSKWRSSSNIIRKGSGCLFETMTMAEISALREVVRVYMYLPK